MSIGGLSGFDLQPPALPALCKQRVTGLIRLAPLACKRQWGSARTGRRATYRPSGESVTGIASHGALGGWFRRNRPVAVRAVLPVAE